MVLDMSGATQQLRAMAHGLLERTPYLIIALLVFAAFYAAGMGVKVVINRAVAGRQRGRNLGLVLGRLAHGLLVFLGLMVSMVIALPSFQPAQLFQVLGIGSVAIGFAFRDILQNFLAGILLLLAEPFRIGDQIVVGDYEGTVEDVHTRATTIRTYDGRRAVIPNSSLFTNSITVNTAFQARRLEHDIVLPTSVDVEAAREHLLAAVHKSADVLEHPEPDALLVDLSPEKVTVRLRWWVSPPRRKDVVQARSQVLVNLKRVVDELLARSAQKESQGPLSSGTPRPAQESVPQPAR